MNKKQLRLYAKKFEGASDLARVVFGVIALLGCWKLMDFFVSTTAMGIAGGIYACVMGLGYWWVRGQWRALLAPPPKPVKKKPAAAKPVPVNAPIAAPADPAPASPKDTT